MKLVEAFEILREGRPAHAQRFRACLVCGFTPLHLETFFNAHLRSIFSDRNIEVCSGLYGDFWGNLERLDTTNTDVALVVMEWSDLDPRLGLRSLGSWAPSMFAEIVGNAKARLSLFKNLAERLSKDIPLVISFPTLPLLPISFSSGWQASAFDLELRACVSSTALKMVGIRNVTLLNSERLDQLSPSANRQDVKSELASGFPYKLAHASTVADLMSRLILSAPPKKGLITDLDDTLWNGILGEVGVDNISWDMEHDSQPHGLYQRLLHGLSESGVLIAAASKNDPQKVAEALGRQDLVLPRGALFPVEAHWARKSESVGRILKTWNIGADSVVFIDDSPMELAEVKASYPEVECILFPKDDPQALVALLYRLRDLFGKSILSEEDTIRRESIRSSQENGTGGIVNNAGNLDEFLAQADAELTLNYSKAPLDPRALELVNKTNQFNLNARRYADAEWDNYIRQPDTFLMVIAYKDKYGPLGKIAVIAGSRREKTLLVDSWVMSCRAFSRRIEDRCLQELFARFRAEKIVFDFKATPKNSPIGEFLARILGAKPGPQCSLSKEQFLAVNAKTSHRVSEVPNG
jgi:FkbH-like protein